MDHYIMFRRHFTLGFDHAYESDTQGLLNSQARMFSRQIIKNCCDRFERYITTASFEFSSFQENNLCYSLSDGTDPIIPSGGMRG